MSPAAQMSFTLRQVPCHPLCRTFLGPSTAAVSLLTLLLSGVFPPVQAAPRSPSLASSATRDSLLALFQGTSDGHVQQGQPTRSRANRRGPDVGYVSRDRICLECLLGTSSPSVPQATSPKSSPKPPVASTPTPSPPAPSPPPPPEPQVSVQNESSQPPATVLHAVIDAPQPPETAEMGLELQAEPQEATPFRAPMEAASQAPGPLPILGGGVAFGFSRHLRRRIKASKP